MRICCRVHRIIYRRQAVRGTQLQTGGVVRRGRLKEEAVVMEVVVESSRGIQTRGRGRGAVRTAVTTTPRTIRQAEEVVVVVVVVVVDRRRIDPSAARSGGEVVVVQAVRLAVITSVQVDLGTTTRTRITGRRTIGYRPCRTR